MHDFEIQSTPWGFWVLKGEAILAGVVRESFESPSVSFVTPDEFGLQVAVMNREKGYEIASHFHNPVPRALEGTQEVLMISRGKLRADLFDDDNSYVVSVELASGDIIILNSGGHGFLASEDCKFIEVKQGPFIEGADKQIFLNNVGGETAIRLVQ